MNSDTRIFELKAALLFLLLLLFLLGSYSDRKINENKALKQQIELLETNLEQTWQESFLPKDSLKGLQLEREIAPRQMQDPLQQQK